MKCFDNVMLFQPFISYFKEKMSTIAIDLGTVNTRAAVWTNGKINVIKNELGNRTTPSYIAFTATERLIGDAAQNQVKLMIPFLGHQIKNQILE
jgi:molecular chaperone DnaK (HSP70)